MKFTTIAVFPWLLFLPFQCANAGDVSSIDDSQRIVVITDGEAIHYARGCVFYKLRGLISESVRTLADPPRIPNDAIFEVRVLGVDGETTLLVGDNGISSTDGSALPSDSTMSRVFELVEMRRGQGVRGSKIETSIQSALAEIQSPTYVEEDRCPNR